MCKLFKRAVLGSATAFLVACGGGGGGDVAPDTTQYPVQAALTAAYTNGLEKTLSITGTASDGFVTYPVSGTMRLALSPAIHTTLNGLDVLQVTETIDGSLTVNGQIGPLTSTSTSYLTMTFSPVVYDSTGTYCEADAPIVYPATLMVNQSGDLGTFHCYSDSSKITPVGSETSSYATSPGRVAQTLDVRVITTLYDASHVQLATGSLTYNVTAAGVPSISQFQMTQVDGGITVQMTGQ